jgi:phasin
MARQSSASFEMPPEMRALAEKSVEQARQAFDTFISAANKTAATADRKAAEAHAGARGIGELAIRFAERNIASSFEFAQQLVRATDSADVMALHADYVKRQFAALTEQAKDLTQAAAKIGQSTAPH